MAIIYSLFGSPWVAALAALLFGLHPMNAERVAWVADRKTVLSAFFALAALLFYIRYARGGGRAGYAASLILYALALLSKPTVAVLPLLLLILDWWPLRRLGRRALFEKWPFFVLAGLSAVLTLASEAREPGPFFHARSAALVTPLVFAHNVTFYLQRIVWPANLAFWYPFPPHVALSEPAFLTAALVTLLLSGAIAVSLRWTRGLAAGVAFFALGFLPTVAATVRVGDVISADRFVYLPMLGLLIMLAAMLTREWPQRPGRRRIVHGASIALLLVIGAMEARAARRQLEPWTDSIRLHERMISQAPEAAKPHANFGAILLAQNQLAPAAEQLRAALRLAPDNAEAHCNLAVILAEQGDAEQARSHYAAALRSQPNLAAAHNNLGLLLATEGRTAEAIDRYRAALRIAPEYPDGYNNLAMALAQRGQIDEAIANLRTALQLKPDYPDAHKNMAGLLEKRGQLREAVAHYRAALRQRPDWVLVLNNLAWILASSSDPQVQDAPRAVELAQRACELTHGEWAELLDTLAAAYAAAGRYADAVATAERALAAATAAGQDDLWQQIQARRSLYAAGQPCRVMAGSQPARLP